VPVVPVVIVIAYESELGRLIRDVLVDEGYDVVRVRDPYGAIGLMRKQSVDLVVAGLPVLDEEEGDPLNELMTEFPDVALIALSRPGRMALPVFGRWRREGHRITLKLPFRLNDVIAAARDLVG
jgi:DNA-binding response OmpR family regulator